MRSALFWTLMLLLAAWPAQEARAASVVIDDFESLDAWRPCRDGGAPPAMSLEDKLVRSGKHALKLVYRNGPRGYGNVQRAISMTGFETELAFWVRIERAKPNAAMHIWLFEPDRDGWLTRVQVGGRDVTQLGDQWREVRLKLSDFRFSPRGEGDKELFTANRLLVGCNFADFTACLDDMRFILDATKLAEQERKKTQALARIGYVKNPNGDIAIFKDHAPSPEARSAPSSPDQLAALLKKAGYGVCFLNAEDMAHPGLLDAKRFDVLVLPYGPSFPYRAIRSLRGFLRGGGDFISMGGYAFDHIYGRPEKRTVNFAPNPGFEDSTKRNVWGSDVATSRGASEKGVSKRIVSDVTHSGKAACRITVPDDVPVTWYNISAKVRGLSEGKSYRASCWIKTKDVHDGFAYFAMNFFRADGKRISFIHGETKRRMVGTVDWQRSEVEFKPPRGTAYATVVGILYGHGAAWFDDFELFEAAPRICVNTRWGRARDAVAVTADQIGVFDAGYVLKRVAYAKANPRQFIVDRALRLDGKLEGYAASGLVASGGSAVTPRVRARWISLMMAYDRYGRPRGSVGAVMHNFAGIYKGSSWAYFGVTNRDLFAPSEKAMSRALLDVVRHLLRSVYLHDLTTKFACYRDGEKVEMRVRVENFGKRRFRGSVRFAISSLDGRETVHRVREEVTIDPGAPKDIVATWQPGKFRRDSYRVEAVLFAGDEPIDSLETGFVAWRDEVIRKGFPLRYRDNYFCAGERPMFLTGTNQTGVMFGPSYENPLQWEREFQKMQDHGMNVLRILHISPYADPGYLQSRSRTQIDNPPEWLLRRFDAIVLVAQKHKIIPFPCVHDWTGGITISDEMLRREQAFARLFTKRYANAPGIIYDISNEARVSVRDLPDVRRLFNAFLREQYGATEALRAAWRTNDEIGKAPFRKYRAQWADRKALDMGLFMNKLVERWVKANVEAIREGDPNHPVTDEYYLLPAGDAFEARRYLDFANIHAYSLWQPQRMKFYDRRSQGRSFAIGEFGKRCHPSLKPRGWGYLPEPDVLRHFLNVAHFTLGVGGSMVLNWDWKDMEGCIFPWGLNYPCDLVSKDVLDVWRAVGVFFRRFEPEYRAPRVYCVAPDCHALGFAMQHLARGPIVNAVQNSIAMLLACHIDFGVLREYELADMPSAAEVLVYPIPFCMSDETFARVKRFVEKGGTLYVSGDITYDAARRRTRQDRLRTLAGVEFVGENYPNIDFARTAPVEVRPAGDAFGLKKYRGRPCIRVKTAAARTLAVDNDGNPIIVANRLGQGKVFFSTDPIELYGRSTDVNAYAAFCRFANLKPLPVVPRDVDLLALTVGLRDGGALYVLHNGAKTPRRVTVRGVAAITLGPDCPGLVQFRADGAVAAIETHGPASIRGQKIIDTDCHVMLAALDAEDVSRSSALLLIPLGRGAVRLPRFAQNPNFVVDVGELRGGKWITMERLRTAGLIEVDDLRQRTLMLISTADAMDKAARTVEALVLHPNRPLAARRIGSLSSQSPRQGTTQK